MSSLKVEAMRRKYAADKTEFADQHHHEIAPQVGRRQTITANEQFLKLLGQAHGRPMPRGDEG